MEHLWNKRFVHLICLELALQMGLNSSNVIVSNYVVSLGLSVALAGLFSGLNGITAVVLRPLSGLLSDRFNKKSLMVVASAVMAIAVFGCAFSTTSVSIGFFRIMLGIAFAFKSVVSICMVSLVVPSSAAGRGIGWFSLANTVSYAIGPALGAGIGYLFGFQASFIFSGILLGVGFILAVFFDAPVAAKAHIPPSAPESKLKELVGFFKLGRMFYPPSWPLAVVALFLMIAQGAATALILLTSQMRGISGAAIFFTIYAIVCLVSRPAAGQLSDRYGLAFLFVPMSGFAFASMVVLAFTSSFFGIAIAGALAGLGQASMYSALQAETVRGVEERKVGRAVSTFYIGPDLGMGLGPLLGGIILQWFGVTPLYLLAACSIVLSVILFLVLRKRISRTHQSQPKSAPY